MKLQHSDSVILDKTIFSSRIVPIVGPVFGAFLILALVPVLGLAQVGETYTYPGTNSATDFTVGNITESTVSVNTAFFDGATGEVQNHVVILDPGHQSRFSADSIGLEDFSGTTVVSAPVPVAVTASVFEENGSFEHFTPVDPSVELIIPFAGFSGSAILSIFNPGDEEAVARIIVVSPGGIPVRTLSRTVGPKGTVTDTIAFTPDQNEAYLVVRTSSFFLGGRPVAAAVLLRDFVPPGTVVRTDVAYVPGVPAPLEAASADVPLYLRGAGRLSVLQVINDANAPQTVTVSAIGPDGELVPGSNNPATLELAARGAHTERVESLFDFTQAGVVGGSISISGGARLTAVAGVGSVTRGSFTVIPSAAGTLDTFAYHVRQVGREYTWLLSLSNPGASDANLELTFVLDDGTVVSTVPLVLPGSTQIIPTLAEAIPEAQGDGFVLVTSDVPIVPSGVEIRSDNTAMAVLRALPASMGFSAGDPADLFAVGTVSSNGVGLGGVTIQLTGPVTETTLTDAAGTYVFQNLSPGSYTVTATAIGFTISPAVRAFTISTESSRDNDFSASLVVPLITSVTPSGAPVGNSSIEIAIEGGPFIAGSVVVLGTTEIATTVTSSQTLLATIPASLRQVPLQLNLVVRNHGLGGDFVDSVPVVFSIGNPPPVLTLLSGQPNPLIAGSNGFLLTVNGVGFIPGATVFVDNAPRATTFVTDAEVVASVTAADLAVGGFKPVTVLNPGPAVFSNALDLVVLRPPPVVTLISPSVTNVRLSPNLPPLMLTATGSGFEDGATVLVNSAPVLTEFVSSTSLTASIPASLLSVSGIASIQVENPAPTLAPSFAFPLTLENPVPVLTSVDGAVAFDPTRPEEEQTAPVLLQGSDFAENSTAWVSSPCDALGFRLLPNVTLDPVPLQFETQRLSPSTLSATVRVECAGNYLFQVRSPQPGGGASSTATLTVN